METRWWKLRDWTHLPCHLDPYHRPCPTEEELRRMDAKKRVKRMNWLGKPAIRRFRVINGVKFEVAGWKIKDIADAKQWEGPDTE